MDTSRWAQAHDIVFRLPPELRHEIFSYTLIAEKPVVVLDPELERGLYRPREGSKEANEQLDRAFKFHMRYGDKDLISYSDHANSFFLSHNTLFIHSKVSASALLSIVSGLGSKGYSTRVHGLKVEVPRDPFKHRDPWVCRSRRVDPRDFEPDDGIYTGLRAFRILKPLMQLPWLQNLHVILREHYTAYENLYAGSKVRDGMELVAAVIARLKDLVFASPKAPNFKVSHQPMCNGPTEIVITEDITRLWNDLSEAETERVAHYKELDRQAHEIGERIDEIKNENRNREAPTKRSKSPSLDKSATSIKPKQEIKRLEVQQMDLFDRITRLKRSPKLVDLLNRHAVSEWAKDPQAEKKIEMEVTYAKKQSEKERARQTRWFKELMELPNSSGWSSDEGDSDYPRVLPIKEFASESEEDDDANEEEESSLEEDEDSAEEEEDNSEESS